MAERVKKSKSNGPPIKDSSRSTRLSPRTKKQIDSLPKHAQEIYKLMPMLCNNIKDLKKDVAGRDKAPNKWLTRLPGQP